MLRVQSPVQPEAGRYVCGPRGPVLSLPAQFACNYLNGFVRTADPHEPFTSPVSDSWLVCRRSSCITRGTSGVLRQTTAQITDHGFRDRFQQV